MVNKEASDRVRQSVMLIMSHFGFFADLFLQLRIMEAHPSSGINTMATDYKSIAYSVDFVKKLKTEELQMFHSNVQSRIRGYKHLIMTQLESAGCTDMYFEIVRYECFLSSYIKFGFKFREKYFCGELHFSEVPWRFE
mgnify:CR=1 FL=1